MGYVNGGGNGLQPQAGDFRAHDVAFIGGEFPFGLELEVGGLNFEKEHVEEAAVAVGDDVEIGAEAEEGEEIEGFLGAENVGMAEDGVGATDLVPEVRWAILFELGPCHVFRTNHAFDDFFDLGDDFGLFFSEGVLVGDLEEVAEGFGAFAIEAADGEADFADGFHDLTDLVGEDEGGQVKHDRGAHAGAEVGGAGGEVAEAGTEGVGEFLFEFGIDLIDEGEGAAEVEAGADALDAEVVLLIDHDGDGLFAVHHDAAAGGAGGVFATDEVAFDEDLLADLRQVDVFVAEAILHFGEGFDDGPDIGEEVDALLFLGEAGEGIVFEVPGEADP